jgi:hypothetical protein
MSVPELNTQNARERRQQILEMARSDSEEDRKEVREWVDAALEPGSEVREIAYRILNFDLEADVRACLPAFSPKGAYSQRLSSRALRKLWRRLLGCYAFSAARAVARELARQPEEGKWWLVWIWKDYVMPRLAVAVLIGYLLVAGNSGLLKILSRAQYRDGWVAVICLFSVLCTYLLALAEVQRRVGRNLRLLFKGSAILTLYALFWTAIGGVVQYFGAQSLKMGVSVRFVLVSAASALAAAFLAQLFWQDRSIAEPL